MNNIFKIYYTDTKNIINIIVFKGSLEINIDNVYETNIFSKKEIDEINANNIDIYFSDDFIQIDDKINTIKKKIAYYFMNSGYDDKNLSLEEIYLACKKETYIDVKELFNILSSDRNSISKDKLFLYLSNFDGIDINSIEDKDAYNYNDLFFIESKNYLKMVPFGTYLNNDKNFFVSNLNMLHNDSIKSILNKTFIKKKLTESLKYNDTFILYDNFNSENPITNNTLYMYNAKNVLQQQILNDNYIIQLYFPLLKENNIDSLLELTNKSDELFEKTKKKINEDFINRNLLINNVFENINKIGNEIVYSEHGIQSFDITIHPNEKYQLPLGLIFKVMNADEEKVMIKYNPGKKKEKIYRLYTDNIARNGLKIPFLSKVNIKKVGMEFKTINGISLHVLDNNEKINIVIKKNGEIQIYSTMRKTYNIMDLNKILIKNVNPIINIIKNLMEDNGYVIKSFNSLNDNNVEIINIKYMMICPIKKKLNFKKYSKCVTPFLNSVDNGGNKLLMYRYTRISNYNELNNIEIFILEHMKKRIALEKIVGLLNDEFNVNEKRAKTLIAELVSNIQIRNNLFPNKRVKIENHTGLYTLMRVDKYTNNLIIEIDNIDNITYVDIVPKVIELFIYMNEYPKKMESLYTFCSSLKKIKMN